MSMLSLHRVTKVTARHEPDVHWVELKFTESGYAAEETTITLYFSNLHHTPEQDCEIARRFAQAINTIDFGKPEGVHILQSEEDVA